MRDTGEMDSSDPDKTYQDQILPHVSRTFALTIPQLPPGLRLGVTNAYLVCRIADTIEDQTTASAAARLGLLHRFVAVLCGREEAAALTRDLMPRLAENTLEAERELILNTDRIVRVTTALESAQRMAIERCARVMCEGMHEFQCTASLKGVARMSDLDAYCYYVAGCVGEMLTELFCAYAPAIEHERAALEKLSISFAQGLQMTNILKDVWEDRARGACWLPQELFSRYDVDLGTLRVEQQPPGFAQGMQELIGVAHAHLRNALAYTLLIPAREAGIRRFCLWAIGMAVLTLRKLTQNPGFTSGTQVKISHTAVGMTTLLSNAAVRRDALLRRLFSFAARGLPLAQIQPPAAPLRQAPLAPLLPADFDHTVSPPTQREVRRREGSFGR
jgi:farnesyl-diphosphate farnesyltransferase